MVGLLCKRCGHQAGIFRTAYGQKSQQWGQKDRSPSSVLSSTATIMNPIEGELDSGGQPFSGGQKAISLCPLSMYVCVDVLPHTLLQR